MKLFKKKLAWVVLAGATIVIGGGWYFTRETSPIYETITAQRQTIAQEVSVTGKVKPSEAVDLAFEKSGRVAAVAARVGEKVSAGQRLVALESADTAAQLAQAEAALDTEHAKLEELKRGAREEELHIAETKIANAENALTDALTTLEKTKQKADADIAEDYDAALTAAEKSVSIAMHALFVITDIQAAHFSGYDQQSVQVADAKAAAVAALLGAASAGRATNDFLSQLAGGAKAAVANARISSADTDAALAALVPALVKTKSALDAVPVVSALTATEATNLNTEKTNVNAEFSTVSNKQQLITTQKAANDSSIAAANAGVNTARNALATAQDEYALAAAGAAPEELAGQEARVKQAEANAASIRAQLAKLTLVSPIAGTVTRQDAKVGEIVGANAVLVSVISAANFAIEAFVPEADIAKVKIGDDARVTLDAYGDSAAFAARVAAIDPAETVVESVATYKTTFAFSDNDGRIKSGMTANIDIVTARRDSAIAVPRRTLTITDSRATVKILEQNGTVRETDVTVGIVGSDGSVEITEGITEGVVVVVGMQQP